MTLSERKLVAVSFEFDLVREGPPGRFTRDELAEMRSWWDRFPTATAPDGTLMVFPSEEVRDIRLERRRAEPAANDYLTSQVSFQEERVQLSVTGDDVTTPWFHDFAVESERRWHGALRYFDEPVPAEDILAAAED
jgi:hypothetical protein